MKNHYGQKIKEIRTKQLKLSQRELAEQIPGSSRDKINSYEHGRVRVPADVWDTVQQLGRVAGH